MATLPIILPTSFVVGGPRHSRVHGGNVGNGDVVHGGMGVGGGDTGGSGTATQLATDAASKK